MIFSSSIFDQGGERERERERESPGVFFLVFFLEVAVFMKICFWLDFFFN